MNTGGLADVLLGGLLGFLLAGVAAGLLVYGFVARNPRRGFKATVVALGLAIAAVFLSKTFWVVVLSGRDTHGEPIRYGETVPPVILVVVEGLVLVAAAAIVIRQALRSR
ncbi:hypothetical protein AYO41_00665 [Verrucomicrobia bacterium SCGC AG-212-E04]|nr:hypothetical protein AYO41_00665 [Verrucomicrobia bacterium SCGC AG-212-E04]